MTKKRQVKKSLDSLSYRGVTAKNPPNLVIFKRDPRPTDRLGYDLGTLWLHEKANRIFMLTDKTNNTATWMVLQTEGGGDDVMSLLVDNGDVVTPDAVGNITIAGGSNIETFRVGDHEIGVKTPLNLVIGGTVTATNVNAGLLTAGTVTVANLIGGGFVRANALGVLSTARGNDGEIYIGETGSSPQWGTITAGEGIDITNTPNNIEISATSGDNGEVLIGATGAAAMLSTLTAGEGIIITNTPNGIMISATSGDNDLLVGTIMENDDGLPPGASWLQCDGSAVLKVDYPELFAVIAHRYLKHTFTTYTDPVAGFNSIICALAHNGQAGADSMWAIGGGNSMLSGTPDPCLVASSDDGINWTSRNAAFPDSNFVICIAHNGQANPDGLWIANGMRTVGADTDYQLWTSPDAIVWTPTWIYSSADDYCLGSIYHNRQAGVDGLWIRPSKLEYGSYATSPDGVIWEERVLSTDVTTIAHSFAYNNGIWVAIANRTDTAVIFYSDDAIIWEEAINIPLEANESVASITTDAVGFLVLVRSNGGTAQLWTSEDGVSWRYQPSPTGEYFAKSPYAIGYNDEIYITSSYELGRIVTTRDFEDDWEIVANTLPPDTTSVQNITSNYRSDLLSRWVIVAAKEGAPYAGYVLHGAPTADLNTHFYLPDEPDHIILY